MTEHIINPSVVTSVLIGTDWVDVEKGTLLIHGYKFIDEENMAVVDTCRFGFSFVEAESGSHYSGPLKSIRAFVV